MKLSLKFLVVGCGSIGERHIANIKKIIPQAHIDVIDTDEKRLKFITEKFQINSLNTSKIDSKYDCVFVCTPPISHIEWATKGIESDSNVFIEKPLSVDLNGIEDLQKIAKNLSIFVGYNFRFNNGINQVKQIIHDEKLGKPLHVAAYFGQYLPDWRLSQNYTKNYTANKEMGGGIILDGSHEMDYLIWLFGKPISIKSGYVKTDILNADVEAIVDLIIKFKKNILGHIHLNFVRREYKRSLEILCENGIIQWSLSKDLIRIFDSNTKSWEEIKLNESVNDMYVNELNHVIECIQKNQKSFIIDLENGFSTLKYSLAIHESENSGKEIFV